MEEKTKIKLSIIIPVYNVEKYIAQCLDSVYAQDIPESEYEVICVNDCSPDSSREIVLARQHNHTNLILIDHEVNKKQGAARNTGLQVARGKYIWYVDSDDIIKENVLKRLLEIADANELEILHFNGSRFNDEGEVRDWDASFPHNTEVITGVDYLNIDYLYDTKHTSSCCKIYLRSFLIEKELYFPEGVSQEDNIHALRALLQTSRFMFKAENIYFYRSHENSTTALSRRNGKKIADMIYACVGCLELIKGYEDQPFFDKVKEHYTLWTVIFKKQILYMPVREKWIFCKILRTFDRKILTEHLQFRDYCTFVYPLTMFWLSALPFAILRPVRVLKRKIKTKL